MTTEQQELIKAARASALPRVVRLLASGVNPNCGQGNSIAGGGSPRQCGDGAGFAECRC